MIKVIVQAFLVLLLLLGSGFILSMQAQTEFKIPNTKGNYTSNQLAHEGLTRHFLLYKPSSYSPTHPMPLVLVFHGYRANGRVMAQLTSFNQLAERVGFLVAYPEAIKDRWNTNGSPHEVSEIDVSFVRALIQQLEKTNAIDSKRIYATGMSDGGFFTQRLACEMSDQIAAFAPVISTMGQALKDSCHPARAVPILMVNGTKDPLLTWGGQIHWVRHAFRDSRITSVPEMVNFWRQEDHCSVVPHTEFLPNLAPKDGTTVQRVRYTGCLPTSTVEQFIIQGGGHTWAGSTDNKLSRLGLGKMSRDINLTEQIWQFFSYYHLE